MTRTLFSFGCVVATKPIEARTAQTRAIVIEIVSTANNTLEEPANDRMRQMMTAIREVMRSDIYIIKTN